MASLWETIFFESFEDDTFGVFNDAGKMTKVDDRIAKDGKFSLEIKDDKSISNSRTDLISVSSFNELRINFFFWAKGADDGESFYLEWLGNGSSNWEIIKQYQKGTDFFENEAWIEASETWDVSTATTGYVRFRSGFDSGKEKIILDDITLQGR